MADPIVQSGQISKGDFFGVRTDIFIIDLDTGEKLGLMGLPREHNMKTNSSWATIKPFGKNTPNYQFTGAEDILELEISWWAEDASKLDVLYRCKWLESMTKSDGDLGRPHIARLMWGSMYTKATWIIQQAPYQLFDFDPGNGLRPNHARQQLTLARYNPVNTTIAQIADWRY